MFVRIKKYRKIRKLIILKIDLNIYFYILVNSFMNDFFKKMYILLYMNVKRCMFYYV